MKFTIQIEKGNTIFFLDILIIRKPGKIETTVYKKKACTDLYMTRILLHLKVGMGNFKKFSTKSTFQLLNWKSPKDEFKHIRKTFNEINNYPHWVIIKVFKEIKEMTPSEIENQVEEAKNTSIKNHVLVLPYQGEKGIYIANSMKRYVNKILPENVKVQKFEHQHSIIYQVKCFAENYLDDYIGESPRRVIERVQDPSGRDTNSHVLKYSIEKEHAEVTQKDFKIIDNHFKSDRQKQNQKTKRKSKGKIAEALLIKQEFLS